MLHTLKKIFAAALAVVLLAPALATPAAAMSGYDPDFEVTAEPAYIANQVIDVTVEFIGMAVVNFYLCLFLFGVATTITEWKQIHIPTIQKIAYTFSFPIFMFTYVPISIAALVKKVEWKPIYHGNRRQLSTQK